MHTLSIRHLAPMYMVLLIIPLFAALDYFVFGARMAHLSASNLTITLQLLFILEVPHILFSFLIQGDKKYVRTFWPQYAGSLLIIATLCICFYILQTHTSLVEPRLLSFIFLCVVLLVSGYHALGQQLGINFALLKTKITKIHTRWRSSGIALVLIYFIYPIILNSPAVDQISPITLFAIQSTVYTATALLAIIFLLHLMPVLKSTSSQEARSYTLLNSALIFVTILLALSPYFFLTIILYRVIHDMTAFIIYITHDLNKYQSAEKTSVFYYPFIQLGLPIFIIGPLLAFGLTYILKDLGVIAALLLNIVVFFHYYIEGVIWKGSSPLRKYVSFTS